VYASYTSPNLTIDGHNTRSSQEYTCFRHEKDHSSVIPLGFVIGFFAAISCASIRYIVQMCPCLGRSIDNCCDNCCGDPKGRRYAPDAAAATPVDRHKIEANLNSAGSKNYRSATPVQIIRVEPEEPETIPVSVDGAGFSPPLPVATATATVAAAGDLARMPVATDVVVDCQPVEAGSHDRELV
jgi:hypothetical protein